LKNIALASKDSKVRDIWLVTGKELIRSLLEKLVKIETVCGMTSRINYLSPKPVGSLVLIEYDSCHLYESPILPFSYLILLWSVRGGKLMLHVFFIKVVLHLSVLELDAIITPNLLGISIKLIFCSLQKKLAPLESHFYLAKRIPK
jgi:hypothetical protein